MPSQIDAVLLFRQIAANVEAVYSDILILTNRLSAVNSIIIENETFDSDSQVTKVLRSQSSNSEQLQQRAAKLECSICYFFDVQKALFCDHCYCSDCLNRHIR